MNFYVAYGLSIASDFKISSFQKTEQLFEKKLDLSIKKSTVDYSGFVFEDDFVIREHIPKGFLYVIKDVVAFLITEDQMLVQPMVKKAEVWQSFLVGGAMSIVLTLKNYFLLHGSAVEKGENAFLFLGESGVGKSSLATALGLNGYRVITDDLCPILYSGNDLFINPGTNQLRLTKNTVKSLKLKNATSLEHPSKKSKYGYQFNELNSESTIQNKLTTRTKVKRIVELVIDEGMDEEFQFSKMESFDKIKLLKENVYKERLLNLVRQDQHIFQSILQTAKHVECYRLRRRQSIFPIKKLSQLIEEKITR